MVFANPDYRIIDKNLNEESAIMDVFDLMGALIALTALARLIIA